MVNFPEDATLSDRLFYWVGRQPGGASLVFDGQLVNVIGSSFAALKLDDDVFLLANQGAEGSDSQEVRPKEDNVNYFRRFSLSDMIGDGMSEDFALNVMNHFDADLDEKVEPHEIAMVADAIDQNNDGVIEASELTRWFSTSKLTTLMNSLSAKIFVQWLVNWAGVKTIKDSGEL